MLREALLSGAMLAALAAPPALPAQAVPSADDYVGTYLANADKAPDPSANPNATACFGGTVVRKGEPVKLEKVGANNLKLTLPSGRAWTFAANKYVGSAGSGDSLWYGTTEDRSVGQSGRLDVDGLGLRASLSYGDSNGVSTTASCNGSLSARMSLDVSSTTGVTTPGRPELGLACDPRQIQDSGRVTCNAAVSRPPPDAAFVYRWTVDGGVRSDVTGRDLTLTDLAVGEHTVTVSARDTRSGLELPAETVSFRRRAPGEGPPSDGLGGLGPPVVAGGVIAVTLALGGLAVAGRRRKPKPRPFGPQPPPRPGPPGPPPPAPPVLGPTESPPPGVVVPPLDPPTDLLPPGDVPEVLVRPHRPKPVRPGTTPETLAPPSKKDTRSRHRPQPTIAVRLLLRPSVLSERLYGAVAPQIVGDSVDFAFAGFEVEVGPPGEWQTDGPSEAIWDVKGGRAQLVDHFAQLRHTRPSHLPLVDPAAVRSDANNAVIFTGWYDGNDKTYGWFDDDGSLTVSVTVSVPVKHADGTKHPVPLIATSPPELMPVVGAKPRASASATTARMNSLALDADTLVVAEADGTCKVRVEPLLELFDLVHAGGLRIKTVDQHIASRNVTTTGTLPPLNIDDFFDVTTDAQRTASKDRSDLARSREGISLRCRFRLADAHFGRLPEDRCPIGMLIEPTGHAFGTDLADQDPFSWLMAYHHERCEERYRGKDLLHTEPIFVLLQPSVIEVERPSPDWLPTKAGDETERFLSKLGAAVRSATGETVDGDVVRSDLGILAVEEWHFAFWYDAPVVDWRRKIDPGLTKDSAVRVRASGIDGEGRVQFAGAPSLHYDHLKVFEPLELAVGTEAAGVGEGRYVRAQTCLVQVELRGLCEQLPKDPTRGPLDFVPFPGQPIRIDAVDEESMRLTLHVVAESGEDIVDALVLAAGMRERTDLGGRASFNVPIATNRTIEVSVEWQTRPMLGESPESGRPWQPLWRISKDKRRFGVVVKKTVTTTVIDDGTLVVRLPVSTKWAIQTDTEVEIGPSVGVFSMGGYLLSAMLINRARMPVGDVPGGVLAPDAARIPTDLRKWRRVSFKGAYYSVSKGFLPMDEVNIGVAISAPGATDFETRTPVTFADFDGTGGGVLGGAGITTGVRGYSQMWAEFFHLTTRPRVIDVSSWSSGTPGGNVTQPARGWWSLVDRVPGEDSD